MVSKTAILLARAGNFIVEHKIVIRNIFVGHSLYAISSWLFDNPLYIYVIAIYGPLKGGAIMTSLSFVVDLGILVYYVRKKIDWLGIDVIETVKDQGLGWIKKLEKMEYNNKSRNIFHGIVAFIPSLFVNFLSWSLKKGEIYAFFALSIFEDPFITTAYLRHGSFQPLSKRDFIIFGASVVASNGYWIIRTCAIVEGARYLLRITS